MESLSIIALESALSAKSIGPLERIVLDKCLSLCEKYSITAADLADGIDAFLCNHSTNLLGIDSFGKFEQEIKQKHSTTSIRERNAPTVTSKATAQKKILSMSPNVPAIKRPASTESPIEPKMVKLENSLAMSQSFTPGAYESRSNSGEKVHEFNNRISDRGPFEKSSRLPIGVRCSIQLTDEEVFSNVDDRYRYMFTLLDERSRALDKHFLALQDTMCTAGQITELSPLGVASPDMVWVCGRICNDSSEGSINKTSIILEGSKSQSGGRRIHLDIQEVPQFALFPGQIVLVEGMNTSGRHMIAKRIIEGLPKPHVQTPASTIMQYNFSKEYQNGKPLNIVTACGPFTTSDNLNYDPLGDLLYNMQETTPDVLILVGPFVDISQPHLCSGDVKLMGGGETDTASEGTVLPHDASYEMVFVEKIVRDAFGAYFNAENGSNSYLPTQIILVPSLLDAHHEFVYPQPPFGNRDAVETSFFQEKLGLLQIPFSSNSDDKKRVHLMPNPCMFSVNETVFGVTSNDVLFSLSSDEVSLNNANRLTRLASHILQQQSFYPIFPPSTKTPSQLDLRHAKHWQMNYSPDILILPSKLAPLAVESFETVIVNPGQLVKGTNGGTYASITIAPKDIDELKANAAANKSINHDIARRTNVKIVRL